MQSADVITMAELQKLSVASQNGRKLKVKWTSDQEKMIHHFTIDSVIRKKSNQKVDIKFNGSKIGISRNSKHTYDVPSINTFKILKVKTGWDDNQYTSVLFSDALKDQDLRGILEFKNNNPYVNSYEINLNEVKLYSSNNVFGDYELKFSRGIRNFKNQPLAYDYTKKVTFVNIKPKIELLGSGNIVPKSEKLLFPFATTGLKGVHVKIFKVFENNVLQFFQNNSYGGSYQLREVGRPVYEKDIILKSKNRINLNERNIFNLDLAKFIKPEPGAIYRVKLSMRPDLSNHPCIRTNTITQLSASPDEDWDMSEYEGYYDDYFYPEGYDWRQRDDPCHVSYYTGNRSESRNVIASNFGIVSKLTNDKELDVTISDLLDTKPLENIKVSVYDYQRQLITEKLTNKNGFIKVKLKRKPFMLVASKNKEKGYLKITNGNSLNISQFDVGGTISKNGLKGFLYGERGVWRPGDAMHFTCVLQNNLKKIPNNYPVKLELYTPDNQLFDQVVNSEGQNGFYTFKLQTLANAQTGKWHLKAKAGNYVIHKTIKIETIKPNKLKINLDFNKEALTASGSEGRLKVAWLHGAKAANLKANVTATLSAISTAFKRYKNYTFDDPTKVFRTQESVVFNRNINAEGKANFPVNLDLSTLPSGKLRIGFFSKVFEKGGNFSTHYLKKEYSPYSSYVGLHVNYSNKDWEMLETGKTHAIRIASVDAKGRRISKKGIKVSVYKLNNRWWYSSEDDESRYTSSSYSELVKSEKINTSNGTGTFKIKIDREGWGRYFIHVEDIESRHSCGKVLWIDWPDWRSRGSVGEDASILAFKADKEKYKVGETAEIVIPTREKGRALLSIENGSNIIKKEWVKTKKGQTKIRIKVTKQMVPNVYANITLIQPHSQTANDMPIRMFGITPIMVDDPNSKLQPKIKMPRQLEPNSKYTIDVSEANRKEMTYTLAVVDEGLLGISSHKTPDIWRHFNQKEALGVRTWDMYSEVLGAITGKVANIFAIGGSDDAVSALDKGNMNRFKPVVKFLGPFTVKRGKHKKHTLKMPNYIGSVRVMVVAGNAVNQFGSAEKEVLVKKPLMVSTTLPRVLSPGEKINIPVEIFSDPKLRNAKLTVSSNSFIKIEGGTKSVKLDPKAETMEFITAHVLGKTGIAKVKVVARSGSYHSTEEIEIPIRLPNPAIVKTDKQVLDAGKFKTFSYEPFGAKGTQSAYLEVSNMPHIDLYGRLQYLISYPHGCIEQTTSSVFPQLYLSDILDMSTKEKAKIETNVKAALERLKSFQVGNGGMAYWPGNRVADEWGTNYAGHFIVEAEKKGYKLPVNLKSNWLRYQKSKANTWQNYSMSNDRYLLDHQLTQAYRLYTMALAGSANVGAMNRLKESKQLKAAAAWRLAAAYALIGKKKVAQEMLLRQKEEVKYYHSRYSYTYGSDERDLAMKLETYAIINNNSAGSSVLTKLASKLNSNRWMSTQTTAYALLGVAKFVGQKAKKNSTFSYTINGKKKTVSLSSKRTKRIALPLKKSIVKLGNNSGGKLFVSIINQGTPLKEFVESESKNLSMNVVYKDMENRVINQNRLRQGMDFKVEVTVRNPNTIGDYKNLAINQIFPSGWEIINTRINDQVSAHTKDIPTYKDVRDDRVYTYFDLRENESKTFVVLLNAAYKGEYLLPAVKCEAMYDNNIVAIKSNGTAVVE